MFTNKKESDSTMALTLEVVITFDKPAYLCRTFEDVESKKSIFPTFHTVEDINRYYGFIREPYLPPHKVLLTLTGNLSGMVVHETFDDADELDDFLLQNNILPPAAHKNGWCPLQ